jgi:hypothetical protein
MCLYTYIYINGRGKRENSFAITSNLCVYFSLLFKPFLSFDALLLYSERTHMCCGHGSFLFLAIFNIDGVQLSFSLFL